MNYCGFKQVSPSLIYEGLISMQPSINIIHAPTKKELTGRRFIYGRGRIVMLISLGYSWVLTDLVTAPLTLVNPGYFWWGRD